MSKTNKAVFLTLHGTIIVCVFLGMHGKEFLSTKQKVT